jgi:hypothetical protein
MLKLLNYKATKNSNIYNSYLYTSNYLYNTFSNNDSTIYQLVD